MKDPRKDIEGLEVTPKDGDFWFEAGAVSGEAEKTPPEQAKNEIPVKKARQSFED